MLLGTYLIFIIINAKSKICHLCSSYKERIFYYFILDSYFIIIDIICSIYTSYYTFNNDMFLLI